MSDDAGFSVQYALFMVGNEPYCLWSREDIKKSNVDFLKRIKPEYFAYQADTHLKRMRFKKYEQLSALSIRVAFSHGLETLFSLLCATVQAPHCVHGWISHCKNKGLYDLVEKISNREQIKRLFYGELTWETLSLTIHESLVLQDKEKEDAIKIGFGNLWSQWASIFTNEDFINEYNSIKHGLRIKPGGFYLAIAPDGESESQTQPHKKHLSGKSEFGSSFLESDPLKSEGVKNHFQFTENWRNWAPQDMAWGLHLISMSIANIVSALKIANGTSAKKEKFQWPSNLESFSEPWKRTSKLGVSSFKHNAILPTEHLKYFTKAQMNSMYQEINVLGEKRFVIQRLKEDD